MFRSISGVLAGYLTFAIPFKLLFGVTGSHEFAPLSPTMLIIAIVFGIGVGFLGGYVAARMAGKKPVGHAATVGLLIAMWGLLSLAVERESPGWVHIAAVLLMAPAAAGGGYFRSRSPEAEL